jgi:YgiT-type zinc finger domain-containing protein
MAGNPVDPHWHPLADEVLTSMTEWRRHHPQATLAEIEAALDLRLARLRAQLLQDTARASAATSFGDAPQASRPLCPTCGQPLVARGRARRRLQTQGGHEIVLDRSYGVCPACGTGRFPPR